MSLQRKYLDFIERKSGNIAKIFILDIYKIYTIYIILMQYS